jgi:hypothetical protein
MKCMLRDHQRQRELEPLAPREVVEHLKLGSRGSGVGRGRHRLTLASRKLAPCARVASSGIRALESAQDIHLLSAPTAPAANNSSDGR